MTEQKKYPDYGFNITAKELEQNEVDNGIMFCEDCHQWHFINYRKCFEEETNGFIRYILGFYECGDKEHLWSIDGKRVD